MDPVVAYGFTASTIVVLAVQAAKALGLPSSGAVWVAAILSVVVVGLNLIVQFFPEARDVVQALIQALLVFLLATGLYTIGKNVVTSSGEHPVVDGRE